LGDLKWLVKQTVRFGIGDGLGNMQLTLAEAGRVAVSVADMGRMVNKFDEYYPSGLNRD